MAEIAVLIRAITRKQRWKRWCAYRDVLPEATLYLYNNNSADKTLEIAQRLASEDAHIVVRNEYRQGKGNVIRSMFRDIDADCYLMIDGDDPYPAENAPAMVQAVLAGRADMVIGDRLSGTYFTENKRPFHSFGNVLVRRLINLLFGTQVKDIMTGYRAFSRLFVKGFPVLSRGFEIETEMTIHAVDKNFLLLEMPVTYRDRPEGSQSKLNTYSDGVKVLGTIFSLFKDYKPLAFFGLVAATLVLLAGVLFLPVLLEYARTGLVPRFPTLIVACGLGICSLLSFLVGVILDVEVKKHRQLYEMMLHLLKKGYNA